MKAALTISLPRRVLFLFASIILFVLVFHSYIASLNMWRGEQYLMNQKYAESIRAFKKAALLSPREAKIYSVLGWLYTRAGRQDLAVQAYKKALALDPHDSESQFELGMVFFKQKQFGKALKNFEKAVAYDADNFTAHIMVALSWERKGDLDRAIQEWKKIKVRFPEAKNAQAQIERLSQK